MAGFRKIYSIGDPEQLSRQFQHLQQAAADSARKVEEALGKLDKLSEGARGLPETEGQTFEQKTLDPAGAASATLELGHSLGRKVKGWRVYNVTSGRRHPGNFRIVQNTRKILKLAGSVTFTGDVVLF